MKPSFGVEFEGRIADNEGNLGYSVTVPNSRAIPRTERAKGWTYQPDGTVDFELVSKVFTDTKDAAKSIKRVLTYWHATNPNHATQWRTRDAGAHMHIGLPRHVLTTLEQQNFALAAAPYLPLLYFISSNQPSNRAGLSARMLHSHFCMNNFGSHAIFPQNSHRHEISFNDGVGTIEFRKFDANIPQVSLAIAAVLQEAIGKLDLLHLKSGTELLNASLAASSEFQRERNGILNTNLNYAYLVEARRKFGALGSLDLKEQPQSVKEILYAALVLGKSPAQILGRNLSMKLVRELNEEPAEFSKVILASQNATAAQKRIAREIKAGVWGARRLSQILAKQPVLDSKIVALKTARVLRSQSLSKEEARAFFTQFACKNSVAPDAVLEEAYAAGVTRIEPNGNITLEPSILTESARARLESARPREERAEPQTIFNGYEIVRLSSIENEGTRSSYAEAIGHAEGITFQEVFEDNARYYCVLSSGRTGMHGYAKVRWATRELYCDWVSDSLEVRAAHAVLSALEAFYAANRITRNDAIQAEACEAREARANITASAPAEDAQEADNTDECENTEGE